MKSVKILFVVMFSTLLLGGCVAANKDMDSIYSRLSSTEKQIRDINSQLNISAEGVVPGQAEMWAQMQTIRQDLNQVLGQMGDWNLQNSEGENFTQLRAKVARLEAAVRKMGSVLAIDLDELDTPLPPAGSTPLPPSTTNFGTATATGVVGAAGAAGAAAGTSPATVTPPQNLESAASLGGTPGAVATGLVGGTAATGGDPVEAQPISRGNGEMANTLYTSGTKAFSDRRYTDAVKIFDDFASTYPDNKLISNAYFWLGESHYQLKDYSKAIGAYQQVIEKYPGSDKLRSAMLKQGVSMYQRGQKEAGKIRLNELVGKYPKSQEAESARRFLKGK